MKKKICIFSILLFFTTNIFAWEVNSFIEKDLIYKKSAKIGIEYLPYNKGIIDLGLGSYYSFSNYISIYQLSKINLYKSYDNKNTIALLGRLGLQTNFKKPQFYGAIGLQAEFNLFSTSFIYDTSHNIGINFGVRFGDFVIKKVEVKTILQKGINY